jgi:site-specific DNA-methyltransferase (adenine-specific)
VTVSVLHGDYADVLRTMPDESFDAIIADPPYGETSLSWDSWPSGWPALFRGKVVSL